MAPKKETLSTIFLIALFLTTLSVEACNTVNANPLLPPLIELHSPQNNKIYQSNEILINFTKISDPYIELTSFTYSLDGQAEKQTDGTTMLTGLTDGSHTLTFFGYGSLKYDNTQPYGRTLGKIYFSVNYSTQWIVFGVAVSAVVGTSTLFLFAARNKIHKVFKKQKTARFWVGLACFIFFAALFVIPVALSAINDYLFPHYSNNLGVAVNTYFGITLGSIFMGAGLYMMKTGVKDRELRSQ
jgi:hypothetical protein